MHGYTNGFFRHMLRQIAVTLLATVTLHLTLASAATTNVKDNVEAMRERKGVAIDHFCVESFTHVFAKVGANAAIDANISPLRNTQPEAEKEEQTALGFLSGMIDGNSARTGRAEVTFSSEEAYRSTHPTMIPDALESLVAARGTTC